MLDFQGRLLQRARQICGGWAPLAVRLGVEEHRLWLWAARKARLPEKFFLAAADIVLQGSP